MAKQPIIQRPPRYYLEIAESGQRIELEKIRNPEPSIEPLGLGNSNNHIPGPTPPAELYTWDSAAGIKKDTLLAARIRVIPPGRITATGEVRRVGRGEFRFYETFDVENPDA